MDSRIDLEKIQHLLEKTGKHGAQLLSVLGKQAAFQRAIESEVGQQLLKDALAQAEQLLEKIVSDTATDTDRADFRAFRGILLAWGARIDAYRINLEKVI